MSDIIYELNLKRKVEKIYINVDIKKRENEQLIKLIVEIPCT